MKNIAFIDHSFKKKSRSSDFLINILKEYYQVDIIWDESWIGGPGVNWNSLKKKDYYAVIFFQMIYQPEQLYLLPVDNIMLIPMYDAVVGLSDEFWLRYKKIKFLNFSKTLHERLTALGLISVYYQYFLPPKEVEYCKNNTSELKGFYWQRTNKITWNQIKKLVGTTDFSNIHIHAAVDPPGYEFIEPTEEEIKKYNITISTWFENKKKYLKHIEKYNVFFCPRLYEGIGISFIEAMAMGMCVVAPDNPTMNEYIENNKTGFLYDPNNPQPIDFSNATAIGMNARKYIENGYEEWIANKKDIIEFIETPYDKFCIPLLIIKRKIRIAILFIKKILFSTVSVIMSVID